MRNLLSVLFLLLIVRSICAQQGANIFEGIDDPHVLPLSKSLYGKPGR